VWGADDLAFAIKATGKRLPPLPEGVGFMVSVRRMVRAGASDGSLIEDVGVRGVEYAMTANDVLQANTDLITFCVSMLADTQSTRLVVKRSRQSLTVETTGLDRIDLYINDRPDQSIPTSDEDQWEFNIPQDVSVDISAYADNVLLQRRKLAALT
jgi:hypothetical protein